MERIDDADSRPVSPARPALTVYNLSRESGIVALICGAGNTLCEISATAYPDYPCRFPSIAIA
jgi:hypothetical protein